MSSLLDAAIAYAQAHEVPWPRDPGAAPAPGQAPWGVHHDDPPPFNRLRGPVHARGPQSGLVLRHGREIAAWGEPARADLTFSVAKTYLALLAGVAQGQGLLPDENEPVAARLPGIGFDDSERNRAVTWAQLLTQTSEWEGTVVRPARHGRPLAQGGAGPAPRGRPQGRRPSAAGAGQLLGIQRRAHQPARARPAASLPPAAARSVSRAAAAAARWRRRLCLARLRRRLGRAAGRRPGAVGAGRHALGRGRLDQRPRPGAHRPARARRRGRRGSAADRRRTGSRR